MLRGAAASLHAALARADDDTARLTRALRRSRRREQVRAAALVLPLFLFLAACFVLPIGMMLSHALIDTDIARILPNVTAELKRWDGRDLPPESAYCRAGERHSCGARGGSAGERGDAAQLRRARLPDAALHDRRRLGSESTASARDTLIAIDPKWGERETWAVLRRAGGPVTDFYLLGALDLRRDAEGAITGAPCGGARIPQRAGPHAVDRRRRHRRVPRPGLPGGVRHRRTAAGAGFRAAVPRAAAILDVAAGAHRCVGGPAAEGRACSTTCSCRSGSCTSRCA
jgi:hypothetical protein